MRFKRLCWCRRSRTRCRRPPASVGPPGDEVVADLRTAALQVLTDVEPSALCMLDHAIAQELHVRLARRSRLTSRRQILRILAPRCTPRWPCPCCCCTSSDSLGAGADPPGSRSREGRRCRRLRRLERHRRRPVAHFAAVTGVPRAHAPVVRPAVEERVVLVDRRFRPCLRA